MKSRVVIFGAWQDGIYLFFEIRNTVDVVAFMDNDEQIQSQEIYGIKIISPGDLVQIDYDEVFISSTKRYQEMRVQLLKLGVKRSQIKILCHTNKIITDLRLYNNYLKGKIDNYEERWEDLRRIYSKISLYMLDVSGIGEMVIRLCIMMDDESLIDESSLRIYIPTIGKGKRICNKEVVKLARTRLNILGEEDFEFWEYILDIHSNEVEIVDYNKYLYRGDIPNRIVQSNYVFARFRQSQIEVGKKKMEAMGITGEYVCMAVRSSAYARHSFKNTNLMKSNIVAHEYRNSDFAEYIETIHYLKTIGLQAVRMGRGEKPMENIDNCIDYAGLYADDFMDIFLMANCKFMIVGGGSGIYTLATSYGRPVLFVNSILLTLGNGGEYYTEYDMYIPKKVFSEEKGRYLSLLEIADVENHCLVNGVLYKKNGITFIDNSSREILDATKEILARMNGQWEDTEEDIMINQRYEAIMELVNNKSANNIYNWIGGIMPRRLSAGYIKKNMYLLGKEDG